MPSDHELLFRILEEIQEVRNILESKSQTNTPGPSQAYLDTQQHRDLDDAYPSEQGIMIIQTRGAAAWIEWNRERNRYYRFLQREREKKLKEEINPPSPPSPPPEWMRAQISPKRRKELRELAQMTPEQYKAWKREQELIEREKKKIYKDSLKKMEPASQLKRSKR